MEGIAERIRKTGVLAEGDHIVAGVSGGADSVCLLLLLLEIKNILKFDFSVLHVEHGIRGEESKADAAFVKCLCEKHRVRFLLKEVDVPAAKSTHVSEEETARNLRREAYAEAAALLYPGENVKIALAHNADDQAETVLMHLVRGTGLKGLGGMEAMAELDMRGGRDGTKLQIVRPLLTVERREIEDYLRARGQEYRTDATNAEDAYTRNFLRHHVLPRLRELNTGAVVHIGRTADAVREVERELQEKTGDLLDEVIMDGRLNRVYLAACPQELQSRLIKAWIFKKTGTVRNISKTHIDAVCSLLTAANGTKTDIPGAYRARVEKEYLVWEKKNGRNAPQ